MNSSLFSGFSSSFPSFSFLLSSALDWSDSELKASLKALDINCWCPSSLKSSFCSVAGFLFQGFENFSCCFLVFVWARESFSHFFIFSKFSLASFFFCFHHFCFLFFFCFSYWLLFDWFQFWITIGFVNPTIFAWFAWLASDPNHCLSTIWVWTSFFFASMIFSSNWFWFAWSFPAFWFFSVNFSCCFFSFFFHCFFPFSFFYFIILW